VVGDYIADIVGNDSVLLVQGIRPRVCYEVFYRISHNKGMKPIEVTEIGYEKYKELRSSLRAIYFFHADETKCS
jgi:hypothetical protein